MWGDKLKRMLIWATPWREQFDRRRRFDGDYIGPERRKSPSMNEDELHAALERQFDSLATTITKARKLSGD